MKYMITKTVLVPKVEYLSNLIRSMWRHVPKPIMTDNTTYILKFSSKEDAQALADRLNTKGSGYEVKEAI